MRDLEKQLIALMYEEDTAGHAPRSVGAFSPLMWIRFASVSVSLCALSLMDMANTARVICYGDEGSEELRFKLRQG